MSFGVVPTKTLDGVYAYLMQRPMVEVEALVVSLRQDTKEYEVFKALEAKERSASTEPAPEVEEAEIPAPCDRARKRTTANI